MPTVEILVPGTALLVPGVAGRAEVLAAERGRVLEALRAALPGAVDVRVRPATAPSAAAAPSGPSGPSVRRARRPVPDLGPVGVAPRWWGWAFHGNDDADDGPAGLAASVALLALGAAGWAGPVTVLEPARERTSAWTADGDALVVVTTAGTAGASARDVP